MVGVSDIVLKIVSKQKTKTAVYTQKPNENRGLGMWR